MNKKLGVIVLTALVVLPVITSALVTCRDTDAGCSIEQLVSLSKASYISSEEKMTVLQELVQKLTALLASLTTQKGQTSTCLDLPNNLIIGSRDSGHYVGGVGGENYYIAHGMEVSALQQFLGTPVTGYYSNATAEAVMRWQKAHGMDFVTLRSGVGQMTRAKMKCGDTAISKVEKINWIIALANPTITDPNDYKKYEQAISVEVAFNQDGLVKQYNVGKAFGCTASSNLPTLPGKKVLGFVNCYMALTGTSFTAYEANGKFIVERGDESAKDGGVKKTIVLQL